MNWYQDRQIELEQVTKDAYPIAWLRDRGTSITGNLFHQHSMDFTPLLEDSLICRSKRVLKIGVDIGEAL
jgi:hypothetical protein